MSNVSNVTDTHNDEAAFSHNHMELTTEFDPEKLENVRKWVKAQTIASPPSTNVKSNILSLDDCQRSASQSSASRSNFESESERQRSKGTESEFTKMSSSGQNSEKTGGTTSSDQSSSSSFDFEKFSEEDRDSRSASSPTSFVSAEEPHQEKSLVPCSLSYKSDNSSRRSAVSDSLSQLNGRLVDMGYGPMDLDTSTGQLPAVRFCEHKC